MYCKAAFFIAIFDQTAAATTAAATTVAEATTTTTNSSGTETQSTTCMLLCTLTCVYVVLFLHTQAITSCEHPPQGGFLHA